MKCPALLRPEGKIATKANRLSIHKYVMSKFKIFGPGKKRTFVNTVLYFYPNKVSIFPKYLRTLDI